MSKFGNSNSRGSLGEARISSASSANGNRCHKNAGGGLGMNERQYDAKEYTCVATSRFSMQSELPSIDTVELISAQKKFRA
jgi:hypothetical protein